MKINSPEFPQLPLGTDAQSFLSQLALRYFTVTCLMQMRRFMFIHGESYRPPFIPQASSANQQSAVCTTVELGSPRKGTPEQIIAPDKHAQRVSKLKAVRRVKMFPGFTPVLAAFKVPSSFFCIPYHNPLDATSGRLFVMEKSSRGFLRMIPSDLLFPVLPH